MQRIVPAHGRLRAEQVAAVVHGDPHTPEVLLRTARDECRAHRVGQPFGKVHDLQVAVVVQTLGGQTLVDLIALAPVRLEVALRLFKRRVAAVARSHHIEPCSLDEREVTGRRGVKRARIVGLDERALGTTGVPLEFLHARTEVIEHHARGLLDEWETCGDRAPPENRELLHLPRLSVGLVCRNEKRPHNPGRAMRASLLVNWILGTPLCLARSISRSEFLRNTLATWVHEPMSP